MDDKLQSIKTPYLSQDLLVDLYSNYSQPRDKIKNLVKKGDLIPIKRELYLIGEKYKKHYSKETLANIIYGPSALSLEYALAYHGLIPERVEILTSICFKRNKEFTTPVGTFTYRYLPEKLFSIGIDLHMTEEGNFFMATPEKALCDIVYFQKLTKNEIHSFIVENLRIEEESFLQLNSELLLKIANVYKRSSVLNLVNFHIEQKGN